MPTQQDISFGINHDNIVSEITLENWKTKAVCHVDQKGVIYTYIQRWTNKDRERFGVCTFRGFEKPAVEYADSFEKLADAIEAVNARLGKLTYNLVLPAHPNQYPPERGANIEIFGMNTNKHGHRVGQILGRIPTKLVKKRKGGKNV